MSLLHQLWQINSDPFSWVDSTMIDQLKESAKTSSLSNILNADMQCVLFAQLLSTAYTLDPTIVTEGVKYDVYAPLNKVLSDNEDLKELMNVFYTNKTEAERETAQASLIDIVKMHVVASGEPVPSGVSVLASLEAADGTLHMVDKIIA